MKNKKILLISNTSDSVINFRKELIKYLRNSKNRIYVIAGDNERSDEIENLGVDFRCIPYSNRSKNPIDCLIIIKRFKKAIKEISPDITITFQLKPNLFGTIAAKQAKEKNIFSMVEGLGDPFQPKNVLDKFIMKTIIVMYRYSLRYAKKVFFLNADDKDEFVNRGIVKENKTITLNGIGIDTKIFKPSKPTEKGKIVLMISRLLINKGIYDFCNIARLVRRTRKDIEFHLYGPESQIKRSDLEPFIINGDIFYGGKTRDVISLYNASKIYVSTSHREGFPRTIMEAMSCGKPVIATNVIGNKSVVVSEMTGELIKDGDYSLFAKSIISLIDNEELQKRYGNAARKKCIEEYDARIINDFFVKKIDENIS